MEIEILQFPTHVAYTKNKIKEDKMVKINNQTIYNGKINRFSRNTVMQNLHAFLKPKIKPYKASFIKSGLTYPLHIKISIHTVINHASIAMRKGKVSWNMPKDGYMPNWDIENLSTIWIKAICDVLTSLGFIPDDNIMYVKGIEYEFVEVEELDDRKIVIQFK